jgi:hypothetical protein
MITIINFGFNVDLKTSRQINYTWNRSLASTKNVAHNLIHTYIYRYTGIQVHSYEYVVTAVIVVLWTVLYIGYNLSHAVDILLYFS